MAYEYQNFKDTLRNFLIIEKNGVQSEFGFVRKDGPAHKPTLTYFVRVGNKRVEGSGLNKKEAEQDAAKNMLKLLDEEKKLNDVNHTHSRNALSSTLERSPSKENSTPSPEIDNIDQLYTLCQRQNSKLDKPIYHDNGKQKFPNEEKGKLESLFLTTCSIGDRKVFGKGRNKKESKQDAAGRMLQLLKGNNFI